MGPRKQLCEVAKESRMPAWNEGTELMKNLEVQWPCEETEPDEAFMDQRMSSSQQIVYVGGQNPCGTVFGSRTFKKSTKVNKALMVGFGMIAS